MSRSDIYQDATSTREVDVVQQWTRNSALCRFLSTVFAFGITGTHHRHSHLGHYSAHVGKIHVDHARTNNQVRDTLYSAQQHIIGLTESVHQAGIFTEYLQQFFIGNCDQRIDMLLQFSESLHCDSQTLFPLEREGTSDNSNRENPQFPGNLRHYGSAARARTTAHTRGNKHHISASQSIGDTFSILHRCGATNFRVSACTKTLGNVATELQDSPGLDVRQRLGIGISTNKVHPLDIIFNHVPDGVTPTAANPDDLDNRIGWNTID